MPEMLDESSSLESTTIGVYRTAATVKGGRRFSFGALVVVGNRNGQVGYGYAKANEVPQAIEKAQKVAKRTLRSLPRLGSTLHHEVEGKFSSSKVRLIPASPGTGVVAGGVVRAVLEMGGVSDCLSKCYGSTNARNVIKAIFAGLEDLVLPPDIERLRGVTLGKSPIAQKVEESSAFMPKRSSSERAKGPVNTVGQDRKGGRPGGRQRRRDHDSSSSSSAPSAPAAPAADAPAKPATPA
jgi:small subunit ribosomal protein S5